MQIDIRRFNAIADYDLLLCKPYGEEVASLNRKISGLHYKGTFLGTDEIQFNVPYYISSEDMESNIKNPIWDLIKGDYIVRVKNMFISDTAYKNFIVKNISESDDDGVATKSVTLYSLENQLTDKRIVDYNGESRLIYDPQNRLDSDNLELGFLNYIINRTSWNIGTVSSDFASKYRAVSINNATMLKAIQDVGKAFDCVFSFDTVNKLINVHSLSELGSNNDAYLSDRNFITALKKQIKNDEIKTRLYLYGKDKISIQSINPLGQPYIDNFEYFKNTDYMTQDLIDALNTYQTFYDSKTGVFESALQQLNTINQELTELKTILWNKQVELATLKDNADIYMGYDTAQYQNYLTQINAKNAEIATAQSNANAKITEYNNQVAIVNQLRNDMARENHFTQSQIRQLDSFIKEETYIGSDYTESQLDELLEFGTKTLSRISTPSISFDIDVIDFLTLLQFDGEWNKFNLGDLVRIKNEKLNFNILVRFVGYSHDADDNKLTLKFTNKDTLEDSSFYLEELMSGLRTTATTVAWNRFDWAKAKDAQASIEKLINDNLNLANQKVVSGENQRTVLDERGIWLVKENANGSIDPNQIRMVNNVIALTKDNWNTVDIAISPEMGINAKLIRGTLGEFARVNANQIEVSSSFGSSDLGLAIDNKIGIPLGENRTIYELLQDVKPEFNIHRGAYEPTNTTEPTATWIAESTQATHEGDVFINTTTGKMYEYKLSGGVYSWVEITNQDIINAITQVKSEVNKVILSKARPTGTFVNGDLWIMPSGATFAYNTNFDINYRWQLSSPTLSDLAETVLPAMRAEAIARGRITNATSSYTVSTSTSTGNTYFTMNWDNMTGTWNGIAMPELWVVFLEGAKNFLGEYNVQVGIARTGLPSITTSLIGHYNRTTSQYGVLRKSSTNSNEWYLFGSTVTEGKLYNTVKITPEDGIVVINPATNSKVLQMGSVDVDGQQQYGFRVDHTDGTASVMTANGFAKRYNDGDKFSYMNQIESFPFSMLYATTSYSFINLSAKYRNKKITIVPFISYYSLNKGLNYDGSTGQPAYFNFDFGVGVTESTGSIVGQSTIKQFYDSNSQSYRSIHMGSVDIDLSNSSYNSVRLERIYPIFTNFDVEIHGVCLVWVRE